MFIHKEGNYISTSNNEELTLKHRKMMQLEHLQLATSLERDVIQVVIHKSINWTEQQTEATWHQTEKRAHWGVPSMLPPADSTKVAKRSWRSWSNGSSMTLWWMLIWSSSVPVAVASSECFWMLLKVLKIHDYIILYRVSHGIPRGLIQTLMGTTLDDKPTIHQPHNEPPEIFDRPSRRVATTPRSSEGCRTSRSRWPQDQKPSKTGSSAGWGT